MCQVKLLTLLTVVAAFAALNCVPPDKIEKGTFVQYYQECEVENLCFAYGEGYRYAYLATVPCEKVKHLLKNHCHD
jgi:hypothetical protein